MRREVAGNTDQRVEEGHRRRRNVPKKMRRNRDGAAERPYGRSSLGSPGGRGEEGGIG